MSKKKFQEINFFYMLCFMISGLLFALANFICQSLQLAYLQKLLLVPMIVQFSPTIAYLVTCKRYPVDGRIDLQINFHPSLFLALLVPLIQIGAVRYFRSSFSYPPIASLDVPFLLFVFVTSFLGSLGEEIGWRGYLYHSLGDEMDKYKSAGLSGLLWGLWHVTKIFSVGFGAYLIFVLTCIPMSMILNYMNDQAKGSLLPSILCHTFINCGVMFFLFNQENLVVHLISLACYTCICLLLYLKNKLTT